MDFTQFQNWAFLGIMSGGTIILWQLKQSVEDLNIKIAVIIEKINTHERRIEKLEEQHNREG